MTLRRSRSSALVFVDTAVSATSNFVLSAVVATRVLPEEYGRYSLAIVLYSMGFGLWRAFGSEPLLLERPSDSASHGPSITASTLVGLVVSMFGLIAVPFVDEQTMPILLSFIVLMPILAAHDALRYCFIGSDRPLGALVIDVGWLVLMPITFAFVNTTGGAVLAWGASAIIPIVVGWILLDRPKLTGGLAWLRRHRRIGTGFAAEFLVVASSLIAVILVLGVAGGLTEMGAYRGASVLVGPASVVMSGVFTLSLVVGGPGVDRLVLARRLGGLALLGLIAGFGSALVLAIAPDSIGERVLGESWASSRDASVPLSLAIGGLAVVGVVSGGYRSIGRYRTGVRYRTTSLLAVAVAGSIGAFADNGAVGAARLMTVAAFVAAAIGVRSLSSAIRSSPHVAPIPADWSQV